MFNCLNRTNSINSIYDKERIKMELSKVKKEIESINVDILNCKKLKEKFESRFNANKKIIEKILNIEVKDMDNVNDIKSKDILKNHDKTNIDETEHTKNENNSLSPQTYKDEKNRNSFDLSEIGSDNLYPIIAPTTTQTPIQA